MPELRNATCQGPGRRRHRIKRHKKQNYCSLFYKDGTFTQLEITVQQMQQIGINALKKQGVADLPIVWLQPLVLVGIVRIRGPRGFY